MLKIKQLLCVAFTSGDIKTVALGEKGTSSNFIPGARIPCYATEYRGFIIYAGVQCYLLT